jgi:hypothetical protein
MGVAGRKMAEEVAEIRVCVVCMRALEMDEQHLGHEVVVLRVFKEGGKYAVEANGRIVRGPGHEFIVETVQRTLNHGFKVPEVRVWITDQLQTWKKYAEMDADEIKAKADEAKKKVEESIERIRRWAAQRSNDAGAQRWAQKKIAELQAELERIDRDLERTLKAIQNSKRMLYGE